MRTTLLCIILSWSFTLSALGVSRAGDDKKVDLNIGDRAPAFQSTDAAGLTWKSSDHLGKKHIVVYFYPGDFTPGLHRAGQEVSGEHEQALRPGRRDRRRQRRFGQDARAFYGHVQTHVHAHRR